MEINNYNDENRRRVEKIILIIYSLYTVAMIGVSLILKWEFWIVPLIFMGMFISWFAFVEKYKTYEFRARLTSAMALMNFLIYGIYADDFFGILSTMGALVILLGIYAIPEIIYLAGAASAFLLFYHGIIIRTIIVPDNSKELLRMVLQTISIFTIECVTYYLVKTQVDMNQKLMDAISDLKEVERSKDDFMANVSHEIRTPINTVCGMSEMVLMEPLSVPVRESIQDIQMAGRNLLSVVSDILDFSELQSGKMELVEEIYNLSSTVNDIMNMTIAQKSEKNIELIVNCDADIPSGMVGDEQKLRRVVMNLVNNAIKFTDEGCITISFTTRRENYGVNLIVSVEDTGIGIEKKDLEKLFDSFNQVNTQKNRREGGVGLGLAISKAIVNKMGGFLTVSSVYGKGTKIQFVIPQKVLDDTPIVAIKNPENINVVAYINMEKYVYAAVRDEYSYCINRIVEQLGIDFHNCRNLGELKRRVRKENFSHVFVSWEEYVEDTKYFDELSQKQKVILVMDRDHTETIGSRMLRIYKPFYILSIATVLNGDTLVQNSNGSHNQNRRFIAPEASVLVVDDNVMNLKVVEGLLRPYKIKVFTAISGKEALDKVGKLGCDFIFMDHMMPEMDGVETLHRIRQKSGKYYQNVPIIALTANAIGGVREMFLNEGFQDFVAKPIELSVLERVLRKYIPEHKIIKEDSDMTLVQRRDERIYLEGINVEEGIAYCGGTYEDYIEILQMYYTSGIEKKKDIEKFYVQGDWNNYTILVHALKSTSKSIGADDLSELARLLEAAGKELRIDYIQANHANMMAEYDRILNVLEKDKTIVPDEILQSYEGVPELEVMPANDNVTEIDKKQLDELFARLGSQLDTFEVESVEKVLEELSRYKYKDINLKTAVSVLQKKVHDFDFMGAAEELEVMKDKMR